MSRGSHDGACQARSLRAPTNLVRGSACCCPSGDFSRDRREIARRRAERQPQRAERAVFTEGAEAFFLCFGCSLPLAAARCRSLRIAPASHLLCRRSPTKARRLAPPQHGGARSGASDDEVGGCHARQDRAALSWTSERADALSAASERGRQRLGGAILASGASNQTLREQL
jgi:hypothetical protein